MLIGESVAMFVSLGRGLRWRFRMEDVSKLAEATHERAALLTRFREPFARALEVFLDELRRQGFLQIPDDCDAEDDLATSWDELPNGLQKKFEAEIDRNNALMAARKLDPIEFTEDSPAIAVANRLKWVAHEKGVSQKELAKRLGVSPSVVNKVFKDPDRSKVATLRRVAEALGVDLHAII